MYRFQEDTAKRNQLKTEIAVAPWCFNLFLFQVMLYVPVFISKNGINVPKSLWFKECHMSGVWLNAESLHCPVCDTGQLLEFSLVCVGMGTVVCRPFVYRSDVEMLRGSKWGVQLDREICFLVKVLTSVSASVWVVHRCFQIFETIPSKCSQFYMLFIF